MFVRGFRKSRKDSSFPTGRSSSSSGGEGLFVYMMFSIRDIPKVNGMEAWARNVNSYAVGGLSNPETSSLLSLRPSIATSHLQRVI
jgi:hypothetical protein